MEAWHSVAYLNNAAYSLARAMRFQEAWIVQEDAVQVARTAVTDKPVLLEPKLLRCKRLLLDMSCSDSDSLEETPPCTASPGGFQLFQVDEDLPLQDESALSYLCTIVLYNHGCLTSLWRHEVSQHLFWLAWTLVQTLPPALHEGLLPLIQERTHGKLAKQLAMGAPAA